MSTESGYRICGYARISVDVEDENDKNVSIENQKDIIEHYNRIANRLTEQYIPTPRIFLPVVQTIA